MPTTEADLAAARLRPAYWAAIWTVRIAALFLIARIALAGHVVRMVSLGFDMVYICAIVASYVLLATVGVMIIGFTASVRRSRGRFYRDVFSFRIGPSSVTTNHGAAGVGPGPVQSPRM